VVAVLSNSGSANPDPGASDLLDGLTPAQLEAVTSAAAPLCILASAGAGKTRVLTRRMAYRCGTGEADARHTLAVTFTRKAASELQSRLGDLGLRPGVAAGTFHAHAAAQLQRWWADRRQTRPALLERKSRLLAPLLEGRPGLSSASVAEVSAHIEWAKARDVAPEDLAGALERHRRPIPPGVPMDALAAVYSRYEHEKRRRGLIDFDDLLAGCASAMERDPEFAGVQRWRWRHIYVDEFQDLNPLQHRLLLAWLGNSTDLCVVGDPDQAIYGWNGADARLLDEMPRRWPTTRIVRLDANHRCTEEVVEAAAAVLGEPGGRLRAAGRRGSRPEEHRFPTDRAEAAGIGAAVVSAHREGRPWAEMAVLARTNAQLSAIQQALTGAGAPVWSAARPGLFDDPAVREQLTLLESGRHRPVRAALADLREAQAAAGPDDRAGIGTLADLARAFEAMEPGATVGAWLAWMPSTVADRSAAGSVDAVTLSSFHRAKGLEWDWVWLAGIEEGLVPMARSSEREERQLLYVAVTRAASELHLSWAEGRSFGGRPAPRRPSRWLESVRTAGCLARSAPDLHAGGSEWRPRWAGQRDELRQRAAGRGRPLGPRTPPSWPEPDSGVMTALRAWRLETARSSGVPPYVLLHDMTIEALAALRPSTMEELLAVPGVGPVKASRYGSSLLAAMTT